MAIVRRQEAHCARVEPKEQGRFGASRLLRPPRTVRIVAASCCTSSSDAGTARTLEPVDPFLPIPWLMQWSCGCEIDVWTWWEELSSEDKPTLATGPPRPMRWHHRTLPAKISSSRLDGCQVIRSTALGCRPTPDEICLIRTCPSPYQLGQIWAILQRPRN